MPAKLRSAALLVFGLLQAGAAGAQLAPPSTGGFAALDRVLQRLAEPRRVLVIGAHPDDEDTGLLARLALLDGVEAAYLSLSRGEGGQNLIGPELGPALGLLRSRELLAARAIDGGHQFFTRAYDFGYTRSLAEARSRWPPDSLLKDAVRIVRRFRPHVIVSIFSGTPRDGHGQHQAAGVTALAAFDAAGDGTRFPELESEESLTPWTPIKLYRSTRFDTSSTTLALEVGEIDPRTGYTLHQIAMASRSRHRSQDMGRLQDIGPRQTRVRLVTNRGGVASGPGDDEFFAGVPLERTPLGAFADSLRSAINPGNLAAAATAIAERLSSADIDDDRALLEHAAAISAGLIVDAVAADAEVTPGQTVAVEISVYNGGDAPVDLVGVGVSAPTGWVVNDAPRSSGEDAAPLPTTVLPGVLVRRRVQVTVPEDALATQPYFLETPRVGFLYDWSEAPPEVRGTAFQPPLLQAEGTVEVSGAPLRLRREVTYRYDDQANGEIRREVRVVPLVDVSLEPRQLVWAADVKAEQRFTVDLRYNGEGRYGGEVRLPIDGWPSPAPQRFRFEREGETQTFVFPVVPPPGTRQARAVARAVVTGDDHRTFDRGVRLVDYPHVRATPWVSLATASIHLAPIVLPDVARVGYVRGAADRVPDALAQIGIPVDVLNDDALVHADLSVYDAIVVGSRAYEADSTLRRHNGRLLDYARAGGHLIVQYQQYAFVRGGYAPFPLTIGRPHDRVTDETVPVRLLDPNHPVFRTPNRIVPEDWEGWPQERGLYFARTWDDAYHPLLEMHDPGMPPLQGGMLVAQLGAGTYVYTGLSFFRALPAGNPGAFKLFLNLLGLRPDAVP